MQKTQLVVLMIPAHRQVIEMDIIEYSVDSRQGTTDTGVRCYRGNNFYASHIRWSQLMYVKPLFILYSATVFDYPNAVLESKLSSLKKTLTYEYEMLLQAIQVGDFGMVSSLLKQTHNTWAWGTYKGFSNKPDKAKYIADKYRTASKRIVRAILSTRQGYRWQ